MSLHFQINWLKWTQMNVSWSILCFPQISFGNLPLFSDIVKFHSHCHIFVKGCFLYIYICIYIHTHTFCSEVLWCHRLDLFSMQATGFICALLFVCMNGTQLAWKYLTYGLDFTLSSRITSACWRRVVVIKHRLFPWGVAELRRRWQSCCLHINKDKKDHQQNPPAAVHSFSLSRQPLVCGQTRAFIQCVMCNKTHTTNPS